MNELNDKKPYIIQMKKNFTIQFTLKEWEMIEELEEKTNASSKAAVIRTAVLKYYKSRVEEKVE